VEIKRTGTQPSGKGSTEYFTGTVRIDPLFQPTAPARTVGASVTFEPGARTAWHTHPLGQTLLVTAGCGMAQRWGGPIEEIRPPPFKNNSTEKPSIGWNRLATNNISPNEVL
jgi:quercetin dioxygenase-like cupin family protein